MAGLNVPDPLGLWAKVTVPVGVMAVPELVSVTVAVQVVGALKPTDEGLQLTAMDVVRLVAVTEKGLEGPLPLWSVSPP